MNKGYFIGIITENKSNVLIILFQKHLQRAIYEVRAILELVINKGIDSYLNFREFAWSLIAYIESIILLRSSL